MHRLGSMPGSPPTRLRGDALDLASWQLWRQCEPLAALAGPPTRRVRLYALGVVAAAVAVTAQAPYCCLGTDGSFSTDIASAALIADPTGTLHLTNMTESIDVANNRWVCKFAPASTPTAQSQWGYAILPDGHGGRTSYAWWNGTCDVTPLPASYPVVRYCFGPGTPYPNVSAGAALCDPTAHSAHIVARAAFRRMAASRRWVCHRSPRTSGGVTARKRADTSMSRCWRRPAHPSATSRSPAASCMPTCHPPQWRMPPSTRYRPHARHSVVCSEGLRREQGAAEIVSYVALQKGEVRCRVGAGCGLKGNGGKAVTM